MRGNAPLETGAPSHHLDRAIGFPDYVAIGFGTMIGVGWVVYAGQWLLAGGVLGATLGFIVAGLFLVPVGRCYAELTAALPLTGGELAFTYKAFGPFVAFLTGWMLVLAYTAVVPFETIAVGVMVEAIFPAWKFDALYLVGGYAITPLSLGCGILAGVLIAWINWHGVKEMARIQTAVIAGLLVCTLAFCAVAFWKGDLENLIPLFAGDGSLLVIASSSIASVLVVVPFFLAGFDCIPQAAEESGKTLDPRNLGVAIITAIVMGVIFYVVIILALGYTVAQDELSAIVNQKDELPMAVVFRSNFGFDWAAELVLSAALLGIASTLNGIFMASTRLLYALGRGGLLPHWFAVLHPKHHTPQNAIIFVGIWGVLGPIVGKAGFSLVVNSVSLTFSCAFLLTAFAALRLRRTAPDLNRPYRASKVDIYVAIAVCLALICLMLFPASPARVGISELFAILIWLLIGLAFFFIRTHQGDMDVSKQAQKILGAYR